MAEVAAEGREDQTVGLHDVEGFADLVLRHVFGGQLAVGSVRLNAFDAELGGLFHAGTEAETEGFNHCADFHIQFLLRV